MTDKTDEQIEKEKQAVAAMRNARANMDAALERISRLETVARNAKAAIQILKSHTGASSHMTLKEQQVPVHNFIAIEIAKIDAALS